MDCGLKNRGLLQRTGDRGPENRGLLRRSIGVAAVLVLCAARAGAADPAIPPPSGFVNDFAHVIDPTTTRTLEALIAELKAKTGAEIAIITVPSTQPLSAFDYAMKVAEQWKPGEKGKDNGVVFLVAVNDRQLFILTGYGIEGALPDGKVGEIRDRVIVPRFKSGDYAAGVRAGTEALAAIVAAEYNVALTGVRPIPRRREHPAQGGGALPLIIFVVVIILLMRTGLWPLLFLPHTRRYDRHWGGGFGGGGFGGSSGGFGGSGGGGGGFGGFGGGSFGGGGSGGSW